MISIWGIDKKNFLRLNENKFGMPNFIRQNKNKVKTKHELNSN